MEIATHPCGLLLVAALLCASPIASSVPVDAKHEGWEDGTGSGGDCLAIDATTIPPTVGASPEECLSAAP